MPKDTKLTENTILLSIGTFATKGISFIMVPLFSRWVSTADYGTFDVLCTYIGILAPLIGLASNEAMFRFSMDSKTHEEKAKYVTNCFSIFSLNSLFFIAIMLFARFVLCWNLALYFCALVLGEVYNLHLRGYLRAIKRLDVYSFAETISTLFIYHCF